MTKQIFLEELRKRLAVLEKSEQQDIIEEYSQHIDLRMEGGLSEEAAILDFGDIEQLADEILEAYHVDPDYRHGKGGEAAAKAADCIRASGEKTASLLKRFFSAVGRGFSAVGQSIVKSAKAAASGIKRGWGKFTSALKRLFVFPPKEIPQPAENPAEEGCGDAPARLSSDTGASAAVREKKPKKRGFFAAVSRAARSVCRFFGRMIGLFCRLCWNIGMAGLIALFGLPLIAGLFLLGMLGVMSFSSPLPFGGSILICIGGVLISAAFILLFSTFFVRLGKRKKCPADGCGEEAADPEITEDKEAE